MRKPSAAMIVALLSLFVALGGAGMAATGGNFILGKFNSADSTTSLSAPVSGGHALNVTNLNTAAGSRALKLNVASGHAPMTVSSTAKVPNLNADLLDGVRANALARVQLGKGTQFFTPPVTSFAPFASTTLTAPQKGFALVTGTINGDVYPTFSSCNQCNIAMRLTDGSTHSLESVASIGDGVHDLSGSLAKTWLFPVTAGQHTFTLETAQTAGATIFWGNASVTALFVPFNGVGSTAASATTSAPGPARLHR